MNKKVTKRFSSMGITIILAFMLSGCGNQGKSYYNQALKNYNKGNLEKAADDFKKAIELKDDKAEYYLDYGFCLIQMKEYEQAEVALKRAIIEKKNAIANRNNKKAYRGLGIMNYQKGDYETAKKQFLQAMEYDSLKEYDVDIVSYMGSTDLKLGNYEAAAEEFTQVLKEDKKNLGALLSRAEVNRLFGRTEDSIADYEQAKKLNKNNQEIYLGLYQAYQDNKDTENANKVLDEVTNLDVVDDEDKFYLAVVQYYQGNLAQAKDGFLAASAQGISKSDYYLGDISFNEKDYASAINYFETYKKSEASVDGTFYNKLAISYMNQKSYKKALKAVKKGLKCADSTNKQELLRNEIAANEHLGDFKNAYVLMQSYIAAYPEDEEAKRDLVFLETRQNGAMNSDEKSADSKEIDKP